MKPAAMYLRVSTREQTTENQRLELQRVATAKGWQIVDVYEDEGISGAKGRETRPGYDRALRDATKAKYDILMAWDVSRLGRSLGSLVQVLGDLHSSGIELYLHQQAIDTTTPSGKAMFQMTGVFAEFEREMVRERVLAGLARAVTKGARLGRPKKKIDDAKLRQARSEGCSMRKIASIHGVSVGTVHRILRARP